MENIQYYLSNLNPFQNIDFSILWNWLPQDFQSTIFGIVSLSIILSVIGIVRKFIPVS